MNLNKIFNIAKNLRYSQFVFVLNNSNKFSTSFVRFNDNTNRPEEIDFLGLDGTSPCSTKRYFE